MLRRTKFILGFSLIYWGIVIVGIILFSVSFQKVPIGYFGLKANYFNPNVVSTYYTPGLYDIGVGFYFILYPSAKQYLIDNKINVINQNLQKLVVTYSIVYRINPSQIYNLYSTMGYNYEQILIASCNNIISGQFMSISQENSRVTIQSSILTSLKSSNQGKIGISLSNAIVVQAFFINQIDFPQQIQAQYQDSMSLSDSYEQSYETAMIQLQKTRMQVQSLQQTISIIKQQYQLKIQQTYNNQFANVISTDHTNEQLRQIQLSANYFMKRIWTVIFEIIQYYNSTRMIFI